jgi:DNA-binding beta-propeller fold protein YncE
MKGQQFRLFISFFYLLPLLFFTCCVTMNQTERSNTDVPTIYWPPPPQKPRIQYLQSLSKPSDMGIRISWFRRVIGTIFGSDTTEEILLRPYGVFADSDRIYVTDPGASVIHIFDRKENKHFKIEKIGDESLITPIGISVDENGNMYITDSSLNRVFVLDRDGKYLKEIGRKELFQRPSGIVVTEDRVYVVDTHKHQVMVFDKKGALLFTFGSNGKENGNFNYPTNITISKEGFIYVVDTLNFRVQVFNKDGAFLSAFGRQGDGSGDFSRPKGIAIDSEGHIYVVDADFDVVQIFDRDGKFLLSFGGTGSGRGNMSLPSGLFIDKNDLIYCADSYNRRVQIFRYLKEER